MLGKFYFETEKMTEILAHSESGRLLFQTLELLILRTLRTLSHSQMTAHRRTLRRWHMLLALTKCQRLFSFSFLDSLALDAGPVLCR